MNSHCVMLLAVLFHAAFQATSQAPDPMQRGNQLIAAKDYAGCQATFEEALLKEPGNLAFRSQLGLCLSQQGKYDEATKELSGVLAADPNHPAALWYRSINYYLAGAYSDAIASFELALLRLPKGSPQVFAANWHIGSSYQKLLRTKGLTYTDVDSMLAAFGKYLKLQPQAPDREELEHWLKWVKKNRPPQNVERWIAVNPG